MLFLIASFLSGCASQILKSYIGKDIREVMLDYGPPTNAFDMGDGRRAFQWVMNRSYTTPTTTTPINATTTGHISSYGVTSWINTNTTITGGQTIRGKTIKSKCVYTLFGRWNTNVKSWFISNFKKPNFRCE